MTYSLSATVSTARGQAIIDNAGTGCKVRIYSGTVPATIGTALGAQVLLAELTIAGALGSMSGNTLTFGTVTSDSSADNAGTPTFARVYKSDGTTGVLQCSAGVGSGDLNAQSILAAGQTVGITSWTLTEP